VFNIGVSEKNSRSNFVVDELNVIERIDIDCFQLSAKLMPHSPCCPAAY
jgi:hypothetical protein